MVIFKIDVYLQRIKRSFIHLLLKQVYLKKDDKKSELFFYHSKICYSIFMKRCMNHSFRKTSTSPPGKDAATAPANIF